MPKFLLHWLIVFALIIPIMAPFEVLADTTATSTSTQDNSTTSPFVYPSEQEIINAYKPQTFDNLPPLPANLSKIPLIVETDPQYPKPFDKVTVQVTSYSTDLNRNQIVWTKDGKTVSRGINNRSYTFTAGPLGKATVIGVTVYADNGSVNQQNVTIRPATVDLVWQADTYTPPFYKGKTMYSHQSPLSIVAFPHLNRSGININPATLVYKWYLDNAILADKSGYGKNVLELEEKLPMDQSVVSVDVSTTDNQVTGHADVVIQSITPSILLYEDNPLLGFQFQKNLNSSLSLNDKEFHIQAMPFFFSVKKANDYHLKYTWALNGQETDQGGNAIVLRNDTENSGVSQIDASVDNKNSVFQTAGVRLPVFFGEQKNNAFGF